MSAIWFKYRLHNQKWRKKQFTLLSLLNFLIISLMIECNPIQLGHFSQKNQQFEGLKSFLWDHWYPCFGLMVTSPLGFKARVGSLIGAWRRRTCYTFPDTFKVVVISRGCLWSFARIMWTWDFCFNWTVKGVKACQLSFHQKQYSPLDESWSFTN